VLHIALLIQHRLQVQVQIERTPFILKLDPSARHPLQAWKGDRLVAETLIPSHHPWKIVTANVDGKCPYDVAIGVREKTHQLKFEHNTIFVMHFDGKTIARKWAGSTLGADFSDFAFASQGHHKPDLLITLDKPVTGGTQLVTREWNGFGFHLVGRPKVLINATDLQVSGNIITANQNGKRVSFELRGLL